MSDTVKTILVLLIFAYGTFFGYVTCKHDLQQCEQKEVK